MKVFPDGKLYIISGCPCDPDYEHTLYWPNKEGQHAYFLTKAKYRVDNMSYQRAKRGRVRVQYKVEDLYDCNYIAFQNSSFGDKWFYAFIDDVTYVNNITSEISYTIDVIQTWITEMDLQQCFVAREHSVTDVAGDNRVPEGLDIGDMVCRLGFQNLVDFRETQPIIMVAKGTTSTGGAFKGGFYGQTFSMSLYDVYPCTEEGIAQLEGWLKDVGFWNEPQAVQSIFMGNSALGINRSGTPFSATKNFSVPFREGLRRKDGSPVRNQKLNTYPYTFLRVTNMAGQVHDYYYELFPKAETIVFQGCFSYSDKLSITFAPMGYKSVPSLAIDPNETITYDAFPMCSYAVDDFARRIALGGISAVLGGLTTAMSGGAAGAIALSAVSSGAGAVATGSIQNVGASETPWDVQEEFDASGKKRMPKAMQARMSGAATETSNQLIALQNMAGGVRGLEVSTRGASGSDMYNGGHIGPKYSQMVPTQEYIDRLDNYFSRYGYKTNNIKVPNISSRPHWNYVQTVGCKVGGSIPCTDERAICAIFDHGVTFWKNPEEVGNFSLDNSPS